MDGLAGDGVYLRLQEPSNEDGTHAFEQVSLMVLEAGVWRLADGTLIEGTTSETGKLTPQGFDFVGIDQGFSDPIAVTAVQTTRGADYVTTRHVHENGDIRISMQEEEAKINSNHAVETLGVIAVESGLADAGGLQLFATNTTATDSTGTQSFPAAFNGGMITTVLAAVASFQGANPAGVRGLSTSSTAHDPRLMEDTSVDPETTHGNERVDLVAVSATGSLFGTAADPVLEVGKLSLNHVPQTVSLSHAYDDPVVLGFVATSNGPVAVDVRVTDVQAGSITLRVQETDNLNDIHVLEDVFYVVAEAGTHVLPDGTVMEAGSLSTATFAGNGIGGFEQVNFKAAFDAAPVLLSQVQSVNDTSFVSSRTAAVTADSFEIALQPEQAANTGTRAAEEIGWLALEAGTGSAGGLTWAAAIINSVTDAQTSLNYGVDLGADVHVLADIASFNGADPAIARGVSVGSSALTGFAEEDTSVDSEVTHAAERVDVLAFSGAGRVEATTAQAVLEIGSLQLGGSATEVLFQETYIDPVVIAFVETQNGPAQVVTRIDKLDGDSMEISLQAPSNITGALTTETVNYMVIEQGRWILENGATLVAGDIATDALANAQFDHVGFGSGSFDARPIFLAQVQTSNDSDYLFARSNGVSQGGASLALQKEQAANTTTGPTETIGWVAIEGGLGGSDSFDWVSFESGPLTGTPNAFSFTRDLGADPVVLAHMPTFNGSDPATVRGQGATSTAFTAIAQEDQSQDAELNHVAEGVAFFATTSTGVLMGYADDLFGG